MFMKNYDIIVRGGYGLTNFGDDALLKSIHTNYLFNYSEEDLAYSSTNAEYLKKDIGNFDILPLDVNYNKVTKILIYGGGTQFYSFKAKKSLLKKILSNFHLVFDPKKIIYGVKNVIVEKWFSRYNSDNNNSPIKMAFGIGVGPFLEGANPIVEKQTKALFQRMAFVAVRDKYSFQKCKEWGVKNFDIYSDLCFNMEHEDFFPKEPKQKLDKIGVVVRDWDKTKKGDSYRLGLLESVRLLREEGKEVQFIIFAKDKDNKWMNALKKENEKFLLWNPEIYSIDKFFSLLSYFDLFVTARYHGAIFSAMLGKPFITIEIEQKLSMISEVFSDSSFNWSYPFQPNDLLKNIENIESNYVAFSSNVVKEALNQRKLAKKMNSDLKNSIKKALGK